MGWSKLVAPDAEKVRGLCAGTNDVGRTNPEGHGRTEFVGKLP